MAVAGDFTELKAFAATLDATANASSRQVRGVVERGAINIKGQLRDEMGRSRHFRQIAPSISYTVREVGAFGGGLVEAEIGPSKRRRAARLANIAYFGSSRGGGTVPDPRGALEAEAPAFEKALGDLLGELP